MRDLYELTCISRGADGYRDSRRHAAGSENTFASPGFQAQAFALCDPQRCLIRGISWTAWLQTFEIRTEARNA